MVVVSRGDDVEDTVADVLLGQSGSQKNFFRSDRGPFQVVANFQRVRHWQEEVGKM